MSPATIKTPLTITFIATSLLILGCRSMDPLDADLPESAMSTSTIDVLILGTYHMGNPGMDVVNVQADDVTTPGRQKELEDVAEQLAVFAPTIIAVEYESEEPGFTDLRFGAFDPEIDLATSRNETVQVGYRLAHRVGATRVIGIDDSSGEISYFPYDRVEAFVELTGRQDWLKRVVGRFQDFATEFESRQTSTSIGDLLIQENDGEKLTSDHANFYYTMLKLADEKESPGAALNYGWYARNAVIFSRLASIAQPGDRIVVLFGLGHAYWLRHFVETTPGFRLIEVSDYLHSSAR